MKIALEIQNYSSDLQLQILMVLNKITAAVRSGIEFDLIVMGRKAKKEAYLPILTKIADLIQSGKSQTKREFYYQNFTNYSQVKTNQIIENVQKSFKVKRDLLNITATPKGIVAGRIQFRLKNGDILTGGEMQIPPFNQIDSIKTDANSFLVVEKYCVFQSLIQNEFTAKYKKTLLVTAKGYPDFSTREFLNALSDLIPSCDWINLASQPPGLQEFWDSDEGNSEDEEYWNDSDINHYDNQIVNYSKCFAESTSTDSDSIENTFIHSLVSVQDPNGIIKFNTRGK
jgi:hypothetical protein